MLIEPWNNPKFAGDRADNLPFHVDLDDYGVPGIFIEWLQANCHKKWGWYFTGDLTSDFSGRNAFVTFEDRDEAILFKLSCLGTDGWPRK